MRISEVTIRNFKNYIGEHRIVLNKRITILYGENGYGKSSFFDAIEWALTGTINRFEKDTNFSVQDLINDTVYNDTNQECSVSIRLNELWVTRYINLKNKNAYVKLRGFYINKNNVKKEVDRTGKENVESILKEILFNGLNKNTLLNNMIKQSFILSQDQVADFIVRDDPKERYKSIADIMGLRKIINYTENIKQFLQQLRSREKDLIGNIEKQTSIVKLVNKDQEKLEDLQKEFLKVTNEQHFIDENNFNEKIDNKFQVTNKLIYKINSVNDLYKKLIEINIPTHDSLSRKEENLRNKIARYYKHISYVEGNINNLETFLSRMSKRETEMKEYNALLQRKENIENKIGSIIKSLKNNNLYSDKIETVDVDKSITKTQNEIDILNFSLLNIEDYVKAKEFINNVGNIEKSLDLELKKVNIILKRKQKWFDKLSTVLANQNNNNSLSSLLEGIKEILDYTQQLKEDKLCPVCSSEVQGSLQQNIKTNIDRYKNLLLTQSLKVQRLSKLITHLRNQLNALKKDIKGIKEQNERLEEDKKFYQELFKSITSQNNFVQEIISYDKEYLNTRLSIARDKISSLIKIKQDMSELSNLKLNLSNLTQQISNKLRERVDHIEQGIHRKKRIRIKRSQYVSYVKSILEKLQVDIDVYKSYLDKIRGEKNLHNEFLSRIEYNNQKINDQQKVLQSLKDIEQRFYQFRNNKDIYSKIDKAKVSLEQFYKNKKDNEILILTLEEHLKEINQTFGEEAMDFLNKPHSLIQKYYRYMNPMTTSKHLRFLSNSNEELQIKIYDEKNESQLNAKTTLSSGQLNVLAISIFLASGNSFDSNIDFIGIDDPIQNMDDVNRFSICDMIGSIEKQLIFSTHDLEFLKLFIKKNEHVSDDIQVFNFTSPILKESSIGRITL